jgi:membrane-bound serine protease (ClpP class)
VALMRMFFGVCVLFWATALAAQSHVDVIEVNGVVNPVADRFIHDAIRIAEDDGAQCLIIELDTPGGLMESMHSIKKNILASEVPVVVFVSPGGARAASAGVWITLASHIAVMAPGTHIGAAHPVAMGGQEVSEDMEQKLVNDAVADIRSLAEKRGRNADWAEEAVRQSVSITEKEALQEGVIDFISDDLRSLLNDIDGWEITVAIGERVLDTQDAEIRRIDMSLRYRILDTISNPNVAYILLLLGFYGLFFELSNPGSILPGVVGGICLILAFFALHTLPINYAGLLLIIFALILFIAEIKVPSYGLLTVGGVISMILGSIMLIKTPAEFLRISWMTIIPAVIVTVAFFVFAMGMALRARLKKPTTGQEGLIGEIGMAKSRLAPEGKIFVHGEFWNAVSNEPIEEGEEVVVEEVQRMKLKVKKRS